jgi:hypothetical protein
MNKVLEIKESIKAILNTLHARVFYNDAPDDAIYPYVVFNLPNSIDSGTLENFVLDVDVWDDNSDTTDLETLIGNIDSQLHKKSVVIDNKLGFVIYRENRIPLDDEDVRIKRRKYVYQLRSYEKYYKT